MWMLEHAYNGKRKAAYLYTKEKKCISTIVAKAGLLVAPQHSCMSGSIQLYAMAHELLKPAYLGKYYSLQCC
jgi:hypothetical protein